IVLIGAVALDVFESGHPFHHAAHQRRALVAGEIEAAARLQILKQRLEIGVAFRGHQSASPETRVTSAGAISSSGSAKSTHPVCAAAPGIPKNSAVSLFCANTVPPIF